MSIEPLKNLLTTQRANLTKLNHVSLPSEDTPALAELKTVLRLSIAVIEVALRRSEELGSGRE